MTDRASDQLAASLAAVRARIARAAATAGRQPSEVCLIAVSKTFPLEDVIAAAAAGQHDFGENRVQEALQKQQALQQGGQAAEISIDWHLIGHLQ